MVNGSKVPMRVAADFGNSVAVSPQFRACAARLQPNFACSHNELKDLKKTRSRVTPRQGRAGAIPTSGIAGGDMMPAPSPITTNPFLLPVCDCGGPMNLASLEPHPTDPSVELKTYKCRRCGKQHVLTAKKRAPARE
jgi:hypothetical protein